MSFIALQPEYAAYYQRMSVRPSFERAFDATARRLLKDLRFYAPVAATTGVPIPVIMCISEREMSGNLRCNLAQGDPLTALSVHVPRGEPKVGHPPPFTFEEAAIRALQIDRLDKVEDWSIVRAAYEFEIYNGMGYRGHGRPSAYLWAGTTIQQAGKFTSDGHWDGDHLDTQLGVMPLLRRIMEIDGTLKLPFGFEATQPVPPLLGGDHDAWWLQRALAALGHDPNGVDGSVGRFTRQAVRSYQESKGGALAVDGLPGPKTFAALQADVAAKGLTLLDGPEEVPTA